MPGKIWLSAAALALLPFFGGAAPAAAQDYTIPIIDSVTGYAAFIGHEANEALEVVTGVINRHGGIHGKPVRFVIKDDGAVPQVSVQLTDALLAKPPTVFMGGSFTSTCNAITPLLKQGPVLYCFAPGSHPPAGGYVFSSGVSTLDLAAGLLRFFRDKHWTRLALITSTDATGQDADQGFADLLARPENRGITLVEHVHFNTSDVSVAAQIERVRAAKAQAFIVWTTGSPAGTIFRAITQAGLDIPIATTSGNMTYPQMKQFAAFLPKELYFPAPLWPLGADPLYAVDPRVAAKQKEFFAAYAAAGRQPDEGSLLGWDPAILVADALNALPPGASAATLRDYLAHLTDAPGVSGLYNFVKSPQRGLSLENVLVTRWDASRGRWDVVAKPTGVPLAQ